MMICIPVDEDRGLQSPVCAHFGSAPLFLIVDTDTGTSRAIASNHQHHGHGMCQPLATLADEAIDGLVVGGIGLGALAKLRAANVRVFICDLLTVEDAVAALKLGTLAEATPATACTNHGGHDRGRPGQRCGGDGLQKA